MYPIYLINTEIEKALIARKNGNEGMARVCARRAAGMAVRNFLLKQEKEKPGLNNYEILLDDEVIGSLPEKLVKNLEHLTMRVDENFKLPKEINLVSDAREVVLILSNLE